MKLIILLLLTGMHLVSYSQEKLPTRQKVYKISIAHTYPKISSGYLAAINDSSISLTTMAASIRFSSIDKVDLATIHYGHIEMVTLKRKGSFGRGMLQGALVGVAAGAITGLIIGGDPPCDRSLENPLQIFPLLDCAVTRTTGAERAILLGSGGALGGALIGGIIGTVARKRFIIKGNKEKFQEMQISVMDRMYGSGQNK